MHLLITGAGKTYTMLGTAEERGIMARTMNDLFLEMEKTQEDMAYRVTVSFLEVCLFLNTHTITMCIFIINRTFITVFI